MIGFGVTTSRSGPLFDGRAEMALRDFCDDWEEAYGDETLDAVQARLRKVLRHPTGRYQSRLNVRASGAGQEVNDRNCIYGPWLEGTGSRNRTTRFKGYSTFRLVAQQQQARAGADANAMIKRYLGRMQ